MPTKKVALITGASGTLGSALSLKLAAEHVHILALGRDIPRLEKLDDAIQNIGGSSTLIPLDLLEYPAIYKLAKSLAQRFGHLDIFISCAAVLPLLTPLHHFSPLEWEMAMGVNCTANWHLIRALSPLLTQGHPAWAIFVTDHNAPQAYWGAYNASKRALDSLVSSWKKEKENEQLAIHLFSPPLMLSPLRKKAMPGIDPSLCVDAESVADHLLLENKIIQKNTKSIDI